MAQQDPWRDERDEGASPSQLSGSCATRHCHAGGPAHRTPPKAVCCESSTSGSDTEDPVPDLLEGGLTSSSDSPERVVAAEGGGAQIDERTKLRAALRLKVGLPVMVLRNINVRVGVVNGAFGTVQAELPYKAKKRGAATASAVLLRGYGPTYTAVEVTSRGSLHSHFCIRSRV